MIKKWELRLLVSLDLPLEVAVLPLEDSQQYRAVAIRAFIPPKSSLIRRAAYCSIGAVTRIGLVIFDHIGGIGDKHSESLSVFV